MAEKASKKKASIRQPMPEQAPETRRRNFEEVPLGYSPEQAVAEAQRCMQCKSPLCVQGCPVGVDIPGFISFIKTGDFDNAIKKIWEKNSLPAVCGRPPPERK